MSPEFALQVVLALSIGVATYTAIRVDLAKLHVKMERAEGDIQTLFTLHSAKAQK